MSTVEAVPGLPGCREPALFRKACDEMKNERLERYRHCSGTEELF